MNSPQVTVPTSYATGVHGEWTRLARTAPGGFAGIYIEAVPRDAQGRPERAARVVVRLVRTNERSIALHVLLPQLSPTFGGMAIDSANVLVESAKWDSGQLDDWRRYLDKRVGAYGVLSAGTDEAANRIRDGVPDAASKKTLMRRLVELRVPCGLVERKIENPRLARAH